MLDGFPRSAVQGHILDQVLDAAGGAMDAVLKLQVADGEIIRLLSSRRQRSARVHASHVDPRAVRRGATFAAVVSVRATATGRRWSATAWRIASRQCAGSGGYALPRSFRAFWTISSLV
ncbi:nucleoside monophosphate kinase [Streptomyces sp. NPDC051954]|uniref:nucleoside monophosphate kinase n=1 Tax=unclassified Streptomyces TaxID=2593676 RepID=UPI00341CA720